MKIENVLRKNRTVLLGDASVQFDANGCAEVDDAVGSKLLSLGGYHSPGRPKEPADIAPVGEIAEPALESMSAAQLKKLARDRGIDIGEASKKAELIEIIAGVKA